MNQTIYPIGIQNFEKIRKDGYLYIDKTALVYQLVTTGQYYFLSRPDASGKACCCPRWRPISKGKGAVRGTGHGETGKGLERIPDPPF